MISQSRNLSISSSFLEMEQEDGSSTIVTLMAPQSKQGIGPLATQQGKQAKQQPPTFPQGRHRFFFPQTLLWKSNSRQSILLILIVCYLLAMRQIIARREDHSEAIIAPALQERYPFAERGGNKRLGDKDKTQGRMEKFPPFRNRRVSTAHETHAHLRTKNNADKQQYEIEKRENARSQSSTRGGE